MKFRFAFIFVSVFEILATPKIREISVEFGHLYIPEDERSSKEVHLEYT